MSATTGALSSAAAGVEGGSRRLRVLMLDEYFPYPPDSGKPIRTWNLLRRLAAHHDVTILCHGDLSAEQKSAAQSANIKFESVASIEEASGFTLYGKLLVNLLSPYPYSVAKHFTARFAVKLAGLLTTQSFDLVHCEWTPYARYLSDITLPTVIATHNIESQIWSRRAKRSANPLAKLFFHLQAQKMERFERDVLSQADMVSAVSDADANKAAAWGARHTCVVDNGVDLEYFSPQGAGDSNRAVFIGALDWFPNVDAIRYFADAVLPLLPSLLPALRTKVIGRRAPVSLKAFLERRPGIEFAGEVPDTRPHLSEAGMVVVPLRIGGGSRLKILEALAMGKAVVSTSIGAEGLAVTHGKDILLADSPKEFAEAIAKLSASPELRKSLGSQGRALVEGRYGWDALSQKAQQVWLDTVPARGSAV
ncbi:MAG TPA: glycosyltransferase [Terriglobales bacterium]|nr:glycosyltransferase [Terriglobales bacterium]